MLLQALTGVLVATGVIYVITPRMPTYQLNGIHLYDVSLSPFLSLDCQLRAGIELKNDNFFGADIYSALIDIYYTDWHSKLLPIGIVKESKTQTSNLSSSCTFSTNTTIPQHIRNGEHYLNMNQSSHTCSNNRVVSQRPFLTVLPRTVSISEANALSIFLINLSPRIYLKFIYDFITSGGGLEILASGVAHVQSTLGIPVTLGIVCDNSLRITWRPLHVTGRYCEVKSFTMGWMDLMQQSASLRHSVIQSYSKHGRSGIFSKDSVAIWYSKDERSASQNRSLTPSMDDLTAWHSF